MKKKLWFYLFIFQFVIMISIVIINHFYVPAYKEENILDFLNEGQSYTNNEIKPPDIVAIPNAKIAKNIGEAVIEAMKGERLFLPFTNITYDKENRLWMIVSGSLFDPGGIVILDQDTGNVVTAWLQKN